jgi:hypothetical protein
LNHVQKKHAYKLCLPKIIKIEEEKKHNERKPFKNRNDYVGKLSGFLYIYIYIYKIIKIEEENKYINIYIYIYIIMLSFGR